MSHAIAGGFPAPEFAVPDATTAVPWQQAHEELLRISKKRAGLDFQEGCWLLRAFRAGVHRELGFGVFHEYVERLFGHSPRLTQEKLRIAEALEALPLMARELETGRLSFSAARELTRVATAETEQEWLDTARDKTVREVEQLVSGHRPGSRPDDVPQPEAKRHVLRFEVSGEVLATFREAVGKLRRDSGEPLDDEEVLLLLARHVLEGPKEEGRSSYQLSLSICECCGRGRQYGRGQLVEVAPEIIEMTECDAQLIGHVDAPAGSVCAHVGAGCSENDASSCSLGCNGGTHAEDSLGRASQTIPPAIRRAAYHRDGGRCQVPGCRNATFLDLHHRRRRSEGGDNRLGNLITLCSAHHRAIHLGRIFLESTPTELRFFHADGRTYGSTFHAEAPAPSIRAESSPSEAVADAPFATARTKVESGLKNMGFPPKEVKLALARIPKNSDSSLEQMLRQGLAELGR